MASIGDVLTIAGHYCLQAYRIFSSVTVAKDANGLIDANK
jgi:hypothetical protein